MGHPEHCFYEANIKRFLRDAGKDRYLEAILSEAYDIHQKNLPEELQRPLKRGEQHSWRYSLPALAEAIDQAKISGEQTIMLEGIIKTRESTLRRIDALLLGANKYGREGGLIWELKRWNPSGGFELDYSNQEGQANGLVRLRYKDQEWDEPNPLLKIPLYRNLISMRISAMCNENFRPRVAGYAYFHSCKDEIPEHWRKVLCSWKMKKLLPKNHNSKFPPLISGKRSDVITDITSNETGLGGAPILTQTIRKILGFRPTLK